MSKVLQRFEKMAGTPFLEQDRPAKVKEIFSALKRDHPDMSAEMKARIASRRGKKNAMSRKSPKDGGPKYKAPITTKYKGASMNFLEKRATALRNDIVNRAMLCGEGLEKTAAEQYFHDLRKDEVDIEMLGQKFCKLAHGIGKDPWDLAIEVANNFPAYAVLSKTASDPRARELAEFYLDWSDEMEKTAFLGAIGKGLRVAKAGIGQAAKNVKGGLTSGGRMQKAVAASEAGAKAPVHRTIGSAMKREAKNVDKITAQGGGSYGRGQKIIKGRQGEIAASRAPTPAPVQGGAPQTTVPAKKGISTGTKILGGGLLAGGVAGASGLAGAQQLMKPRQPAYAGQGY